MEGTVGRLSAFLISAFALAATSRLAHAGVIIDVTEAAGNVTFSITGSLNLTGAASAGGYSSYGLGFIPGGSNWYIATGGGGSVSAYALTSFAGAFGTSLTYFSTPSSTSGDNFFIWGQSGATEQVGLPVGYVSGSAINSGMIFNSATIAGFTMTPGTYLYALPNDTITLNIGAASGVPEPGTFALIGFGLAGLAALRRRQR